MKYNTRYLYTLFGSGIGIWIIKYFYFYLRERDELDFKYEDYAIIGGISGVYFANFFVPMTLKNVVFSCLVGVSYGFLYNFLMFYVVNKNKRNAEKIGIKL